MAGPHESRRHRSFSASRHYAAEALGPGCRADNVRFGSHFADAERRRPGPKYLQKGTPHFIGC
jgi:hypothetical protein